MADEQNDKTEELSADDLAQVTGGATTSTVDPIKKESLPITKETGSIGQVTWDIVENKAD